MEKYKTALNPNFGLIYNNQQIIEPDNKQYSHSLNYFLSMLCKMMDLEKNIEFLKVQLSKNISFNLITAFKNFDINNNDSVSFDDFMLGIEIFGIEKEVNYTTEDIYCLFRRLDKNNDGVIK